MISSVQAKMARAALSLTCSDVGDAIGISGPTVSNFETGKTDNATISMALEAYYLSRSLTFGPRHTVSVGPSPFSEDAWLSRALYQLLLDNNITPTIQALLDASHRAATTTSVPFT